MKKRLFLTIGGCCALALLFAFPAIGAGPTGAKAIFDSGEGPSVSMSSTSGKSSPVKKTVKQATPSRERYVGISYQLMLLSDDGQMRSVTKARTFRSGERMKMLVRTNRPGYMTILNIGSSGNTNVLFNEYVDAYTMHEIPKTTTFKFVGNPGTETLMIMLSDNPSPIGGQQGAVSASSSSPSSAAPSYSSSDPGMSTASSSVADLPPPPPVQIASSMDGAKSLRGAKDIVVDDMQTSYAVISPKTGWKPASKGAKDIILESEGGKNFGVVPAAAISDGGILTMQVKLRHR
ncbi:protein of unknown function [Syntrophus gentianae]|uniref:DUF4384 domain-containing protein n=1 Tax=Syntrophus gentianae TaxID=43775 RepID=A0A1H8AQC4_9BACT|nr:DUF4384 domain-containing protein [Syntrophus gentianae]SEM72018.1 protein of unknown function [Syntrophus gentianae]